MSAPALNSLWAVRALLAIETGSEDQARDIASQVFQQMDVVFERPPAGYKSREQIWTIAADIDLSGLPVIEPDTARIRVNYVKRNLGSVTWRVARSDDRHETQEWPPGFWAQRAGSTTCSRIQPSALISACPDSGQIPQAEAARVAGGGIGAISN